MAEICPVCKEEIGSNDHFSVEGAESDVEVHTYCLDEFNQHPEKYGGKAIEKTEPLTKEEKELAEQRKQRRKEQQQEQEEKSVYKSVYIKGGVDVKSFDMPFGDMVGFIFKWAMASIPTAIFLAILFLIFTAIFA